MSHDQNAQPFKWAWFATAVVIVLFDQLSKHWAEMAFAGGDRMAILPVLEFTLVYNPGAAWSFLSDAGGWQRWLLSTISAVVSLVIVIWLHKLPVQSRLLCASLALILGGAVGNLIDRVLVREVVNFIHFYYQGW